MKGERSRGSPALGAVLSVVIQTREGEQHYAAKTIARQIETAVASLDRYLPNSTPVCAREISLFYRTVVEGNAIKGHMADSIGRCLAIWLRGANRLLVFKVAHFTRCGPCKSQPTSGSELRLRLAPKDYSRVLIGESEI